jgi:hypothetical protein
VKGKYPPFASVEQLQSLCVVTKKPTYPELADILVENGYAYKVNGVYGISENGIIVLANLNLLPGD